MRTCGGARPHPYRFGVAADEWRAEIERLAAAEGMQVTTGESPKKGAWASNDDHDPSDTDLAELSRRLARP